jgi:uncharacterized membrane protein affecting hemolysin expression
MKFNRIGIVLIASALVVIALVVALLVHRQQVSRATEVRAAGVSLARSLSNIPVKFLDSGTPGLSVLNTLFAYQNNGDLAYAAILDANGRTLADVAGPAPSCRASPCRRKPPPPSASARCRIN